MHDMYSHIPSHLPNYIIIYLCKCISKYWLPESLTAAKLKPQLDPHKNSSQNIQTENMEAVDLDSATTWVAAIETKPDNTTDIKIGKMRQYVTKNTKIITETMSNLGIPPSMPCNSDTDKKREK